MGGADVLQIHTLQTGHRNELAAFQRRYDELQQQLEQQIGLHEHAAAEHAAEIAEATRASRELQQRCAAVRWSHLSLKRTSAA